MAGGYVMIPAAAVLWWISYNWAIYGNPLEFMFGQYSAYAQQKNITDGGLLPTKGNLGLTLTTFHWSLLETVGVGGPRAGGMRRRRAGLQAGLRQQHPAGGGDRQCLCVCAAEPLPGPDGHQQRPFAALHLVEQPLCADGLAAGGRPGGRVSCRNSPGPAAQAVGDRRPAGRARGAERVVERGPHRAPRRAGGGQDVRGIHHAIPPPPRAGSTSTTSPAES